MKASARAIRRSNDGHAVTEHPRNELVIPLPDPRLLRLIARSVFLAAAVISLPWLRSVLFSDHVSEIAASVSNSPEDKLFYMPKLLQDMKAYGLIQQQGHSLFIGDPGLHAELLWRNGISFVPENKIRQIAQGQSLDFVFLAAAGGISDAHFCLIDNLMRVGGVAAFLLAPHPAKPFNLPANYRMVYIQNIGLTIIAVKKLYRDNDGSGQPERRLLSASATMEHALQIQAMEDAVLEQPVVKKHPKRIRYLPPELMRESLTKYPRRVFVGMGSPGRVGGGNGDKGEWLRKNVGMEEYVVVEAEVEAKVEAAVEMLIAGAIVLVDDLFLDCRSQWEREGGEEVDAGKKRKMAYWECLALSGKLVSW